MRVRRGSEADIPAMTRLFFTSVREGAGPDYSAEQRAAWAPERPDPAVWAERLATQTVYLAEDETGLAGFMTCRDDGYVDLAFVAPDRIGQGVAHALYQVLEAEARQAGLTQLTADASALARAFFLRQGWQVERAKKPVIRGVEMHNSFMSKRLE